MDDRRCTLGLMMARPTVTSLADELGLPRDVRRLSNAKDGNAQLMGPVKAQVKAMLGDAWPEHYRAVVDEWSTVSVLPLFQLPAPTFLDYALPMAVIGDALHALPPYTGQGGNLALEDAADAADVLVDIVVHSKSRPDAVSALRSLEVKAAKRAAPIQTFGEKQRESLLRIVQTPNLEATFTPLMLFADPTKPPSFAARCGAAAINGMMALHRLDGFGMR